MVVVWNESVCARITFDICSALWNFLIAKIKEKIGLLCGVTTALLSTKTAQCLLLKFGHLVVTSY